MSAQPPICLSMIVCDSVQPDRSTDKITILGAFEHISAESYPARHPEVTVFAELTDGRGQTPITLKVTRVQPDSLDGEVVFSGTLEATFPDPRFVARVILRMAPWDIPHEGEYRFILETEGAFVAERRVVAAVRGAKS